MNVYVNVLLAFLMLSSSAFGQEPPRTRKPVLVRDEVNKKDEIPEEKIRVHDPEQAKKSLKIGDYYAKRGNTEAADARYREAVDYNAQWSVPYEKLVRLYEKQERFNDGLDVCDLFLTGNPGSADTDRFQKLRQRMLEKGAVEKPGRANPAP
jgi:tetratricopeptide (TPR) repeat protein